MHFGLHLKSRGLISAEQLVAALEEQCSTLVPIGQLTLEEGIMTPRDVFNVLLAQRDAPEMLFGDLAVEMGLLKRDDVMRLMMIQADRKRPLAEILVKQGALTDPQLRSELVAYRRAQLQPKRPAVAVKIVPMPRGLMPPRLVSDSVTAV